MQTERWQRLDEIFQSALDCDPQSRAAWLDTACGKDGELRCEVDSLLAAHEHGEFDFTQPAAFLDALKVLEQRTARVLEGQRVGPYRVVRELGRGGMSRVYLAARADQAFEKQVAIKVVERGLDSADVTQRFQSERQILARLDHPNITRILDGGTTEDGLPYLVMDYVEGDPIDQYCDARALDVAARLKLFQGVCVAVHYAHQNLIIHRDIKPGNVLVTRAGVPRLLDFGIAKLVATEVQPSESTRTVLRRLTPEYASPEQVRGEALTTSSDVYSLGVLLYRLLTGQSPYRTQAASASALERAVCEDQPERPSVAVARAARAPPGEGTPERLRRRLQGDLDNVVLMALRKEPQRRYASVEQLAEDVGRHLANEPVIARADTAAYRAAKFMRRHVTGVAATAGMILLLVAGVVGTSWQARVARAERARAQQQFNDVRKLATSFLFEFNSSIQSLPGATPARRLLIQRALEYLRKLAQQSRGDPACSASWPRPTSRSAICREIHTSPMSATRRAQRRVTTRHWRSAQRSLRRTVRTRRPRDTWPAAINRSARCSRNWARLRTQSPTCARPRPSSRRCCATPLTTASCVYSLRTAISRSAISRATAGYRISATAPGLSTAIARPRWCSTPWRLRTPAIRRRAAERR